jgi:hypothetical protein
MMRRTLAMLLVLACATVTRAQSVEFRLRDRDGWVGTPMAMEVEVNNAGDADAPVVTASPDFDARVDPNPHRMEWRQSINGRTTSRSTLVWRVELVPKREGALQTPVVELKTGGRTWRSTPEPVQVASSASNDTLRLEVRTDPPNPWVGQSVELTLRILVKPFTSPQHGVSLDEAQMWRLLDQQACAWGALEPRLRELAQANRRPAGTEEVIDGRTWLVYEITLNFTPSRPGPIELGDVRIAWRYPTGISVGRDFFGSPELNLSGVRPVTATLPATGVIARALPEAGRPATFRGAVGQFELRATAKPTQVAVGDPITLSLSVVDLSRGGDELKTLQPPVLDQNALGGMFRVPSDPLAGTVDGNQKTFTQTIRPTAADLTQIPPIEFSYFDPKQGQYVTTRSQPIPIRVSPAERLASDRIERSATAAAPTDKPGSKLTEVEGGLVANAAASPDLLADQRLRVGPVALALLLAPPLLALVALLRRRQLERFTSDTGLSRALGASRAARAAMQAATDLPAISRAITDYVADRTSRAAGTVTRAQALSLAREAGAEQSLCERLDALLSAGERAAFAPHRADHADVARTEALDLLRDLDALRWKRRAADLLEVNA